MDIRLATPQDAEAIADIHIASWRYAYRGIMESSLLDALDRDKKISAWTESLTELGWEIYVAQIGEEVKGFTHICKYRDDDLAGQYVGEVTALYIQPDFVGKGMGAMLFATAIGMLAQQGYSKSALWVLEKNTRSIGFYEKFGFRADGASKLHPKTGLVEVRYVG